jgi:hypothetical protein
MSDSYIDVGNSRCVRYTACLVVENRVDEVPAPFKKSDKTSLHPAW